MPLPVPMSAADDRSRAMNEPLSPAILIRILLGMLLLIPLAL